MAIAFSGVSSRSLGETLKGYGIIAVLGEKWPNTRFWWENGVLVASLQQDEEDAAVSDIAETLLTWAENVGKAFEKGRKQSCVRNPCSLHRCEKKAVGEACNEPRPCPKHQNKAKTCGYVTKAAEDSILKSAKKLDSLSPDLAELARGASIAWRGRGNAENAEPSPLFPGYGQEASGNYFTKLRAYADGLKKTKRRDPKLSDLRYSLFGDLTGSLKTIADNGYLFFPNAMKRYATGINAWEQDASTLSPWSFLLTIRGALLLRGSLRRPRWRRANYPTFPFVFDGGGINEVYLPTWSIQHPRALPELRMQITHFQIPLSQGNISATAGEFRAAMQHRGYAAGFDFFYRFTLEERRPGQKGSLPQAIARGSTAISKTSSAIDLPAMIEKLASSGWLDQFALPHGRAKEDDRNYLACKRRMIDNAIHGAIDDPTSQSYLGILEAVWSLDFEITAQGKPRRFFEDLNRTPRAAPPIPAPPWERALKNEIDQHAEWRIARAIGSILGQRSREGNESVGPILEQLLPVQYDWKHHSWQEPDTAIAATPRWTSQQATAAFQSLLWRRWLAAEKLDRLPFRGARTASVDDVMRLVRGELDLDLVHRLTPLFALLDWSSAGGPQECTHDASKPRLPVLVAYAALRIWFELGISASAEGVRPLDGEVPRLLSFGASKHIQNAVEIAFSRLRIDGLPLPGFVRPIGKAVVKAKPHVDLAQSERMAVAVLVPISRFDTLRLSRQLFVATEVRELFAR